LGYVSKLPLVSYGKDTNKDSKKMNIAAQCRFINKTKVNFSFSAALYFPDLLLLAGRLVVIDLFCIKPLSA